MAVFKKKRKMDEKTMKIESSENEKLQQRIDQKDEMLKRLLVPYEAKIMYLQGLLIWETPQYSALLFTVVHILFWLATYIRIYYLIGMTGFCICFWQLWTHHVWPEIRVPIPFGQDTEEWTPVHPRLLSVPEVCHHVAKVLARIEIYTSSAYDMRKQQPAKFFVFSTTCLSLLAVLGHYVRGITLLYFIVIGVLLAPSICYYDIINQIQGRVQPLVEQVEESVNIKRRRSTKRQKRGGKQTNMADVSDSDDEDLRLFVPEIAESQVSLLSLKTRCVDDEEESMSFTPRLLTPHMPDVDHSDNDSTLGDLPSQMPSVLDMEDSLTYGFRLTDTLDGTNTTNSNNKTVEIPSCQDTQADVTSQEIDNTSQIDDDSLAGSSLKSDTTKTADLPSNIHDGDVLPTTDNSNEESQAIEPSTKKLKFVAEHFKQSSGEEDEDEIKLEHGLVFPNIEKELRTSDHGQEPSNIDQISPVMQMGAMLTGALTGAQSTVSNMAASQMVASLMQNTVSNLLGGGASPSSVNSKHPKAKVKLEGQGSRDSDAEFEFLSQEDFENIGQ